MKISLILKVILLLGMSSSARGLPKNLVALDRQLRVDLQWEGPSYSDTIYQIQRAEKSGGPFEMLSDTATFPIYSDFVGQSDQTYYYRVREVSAKRGSFTPLSEWTQPVSGTTRPRDRVGLIDEVMEASVRIATVGSHPKSGLAGEWMTTRGLPRRAEWKVGASGATGMGLANYVVAAERGYLDRAKAAEMVLKALRFLDRKAERFHGAFSHWINHESGKALPFSKFDDGGDIVETALLVQGIIIARQYFTNDSAVEQELRETANKIWREVDWNWYRKDASAALYWHWSPRHGWKMNMPVKGFNESEILYILGMASPTNAIPVSSYFEGWRGDYFGHERNHFGTRLKLGRGLGGCTFWYYYSYLGLDPREMLYKGRSYRDHFRDLCRVQINSMRSQAKNYRGYDQLWGLTAAPGPDGYSGFKPGKLDNGTIVPAASLSAYLYAPEASRQSLETMYYQHGDKIWQEFGFVESFNLTRNWQHSGYLGIDAGPVAPMLENYRTGLLWKLFMNAPEIRTAMKKLKSDPRWNLQTNQ
jgi:hypothetical protein